MEARTARKRPTIRDVAAAAGVSRGTVSRVINGGHWVSPEALSAVQEAIRTTGYSMNQHARSLATGRSNSIAFLLTEPQHLLFEDPTFSILLRGAAEALGQREMPLLLMAPRKSAAGSPTTSPPATSTACCSSPRTGTTPW
jgi:DNA-binding LacI/PurR family transcriptional regulator